MPKTESLDLFYLQLSPEQLMIFNFYSCTSQILGFIFASFSPHTPLPFQAVFLAMTDRSRILPPPLPLPWLMLLLFLPWTIAAAPCLLPLFSCGVCLYVRSCPFSTQNLQRLLISLRVKASCYLPSHAPSSPWRHFWAFLLPVFLVVLFTHIDLAVPLTYVAVSCLGSLSLFPLPWVLFQRQPLCSSGVWQVEVSQ